MISLHFLMLPVYVYVLFVLECYILANFLQFAGCQTPVLLQDARQVIIMVIVFIPVFQMPSTPESIDKGKRSFVQRR